MGSFFFLSTIAFLLLGFPDFELRRHPQAQNLSRVLLFPSVSGELINRLKRQQDFQFRAADITHLIEHLTKEEKPTTSTALKVSIDIFEDYFLQVTNLLKPDLWSSFVYTPESLHRITQTTSLRIHSLSCTASSLKAAAIPTTLRKLRLNHTKIQDGTLSGIIRRNPSLESLTLNSSGEIYISDLSYSFYLELIDLEQTKVQFSPNTVTLNQIKSLRLRQGIFIDPRILKDFGTIFSGLESIGLEQTYWTLIRHELSKLQSLNWISIWKLNYPLPKGDTILDELLLRKYHHNDGITSAQLMASVLNPRSAVGFIYFYPFFWTLTSIYFLTFVEGFRFGHQDEMSQDNQTNDNPAIIDSNHGYVVLSMKDDKDAEMSPPSLSSFQITKGRVEAVTNPTESLIETIFGEKAIGGMTGIDEDILDSNRLNTVDVNITKLNNEDNNGNFMFGGCVRREIWTIPLLALISINLLLIAFFEIYVLCQSTRQSPLFLGQLLLLGLFLCAGFPIVLIFRPLLFNCYIGSIGISISYALIFSVLMVKCLFLISMDAGNGLSVGVQSILLLFSVLVQFAISLQWVIIFPPSLLQAETFGHSFWSECGVDFNQLIWSTTIYNAFLILIVGSLAIKTRRVEENYGESTYIGFSLLATIPIWMCWILTSLILKGKYQEICVAFGCQAQALSTFLIMFMPKGRQLALMIDEAKLLVESSTEYAGEYSPSFYHFQPSKYYHTNSFGATLEHPTMSTLNPNVYFYRTDFNHGMLY